jgi:hypothetical protein
MTNKAQNPIRTDLKSYAFIDGNGNKVTRNNSLFKQVGEAYSFFYCNASKSKIDAEIPIIRKMAKIPSQLELSLVQGMDNVVGDKKLIALSKEAKQDGINYMLQAKYPNKTNEETANELNAVMVQMYPSPLYKTKEAFRGAIVYKEKNHYVFRD